ncbi:hypothetical protein [Aurantiacibacter gilvus]|uniref:Uncharacterized protein n=1 Tax=Aurantiacibacter gilvus TaxID=3139141 RepID=A0ABU9IDM5_9SPHN
MHDTIPRVDWLLKPPGLIRSAACYSAFLIDGRLHLLRSGPGWQKLSDAYAIVGNVVVDRQIAKNRAFLQQMQGWDLARDVPQRAEISYRLDALESVSVKEYPHVHIAEIRIKAREGEPGKIRLVAQDLLGDPQQRRAFFAHIPAREDAHALGSG